MSNLSATVAYDAPAGRLVLITQTLTRMAAYLVVDITAIHDEQTYARYRSQVSSGLEAAGGRYLVRGGDVEVIEGDWRPGRMVIVRFDSMEAAQRWWASPEYEPLRQLRQTSASTNMVLVQGLPDETVLP